jgi:hypothetical protein
VLLGFDAASLGWGSLLLSLLVLGPVLACRVVGGLVHRSLSGLPLPAPALRPTLCVLALASLAAVSLVSCGGRGHDAVASACGGAWEPQALGTAWWLLRCPSDASGRHCTVERGDHREAVEAGQRLIVAAGQVQRIDFAPGSARCAERVRLVDDAAGTSPPPIGIKVEREGALVTPPVQKVELSLDERTLAAMSSLGLAVAQWPQKLPRRLDLKVDVGGQVAAQWPDHLATTIEWPQLPQLAEAYAPLVATVGSGVKVADQSLRLRRVCEQRREAGNALRRIRTFIAGDQECLDAIGQQ